MGYPEYIQSIIFSKERWSEKGAKKWLRKRGFTTNFHGKGTDETEGSYRFRQMHPLTKHEKAEGHYYTTWHPPGKKDEGIAFVVINHPNIETHRKHEVPYLGEKVFEKKVRKANTPDFATEYVKRNFKGHANIPIELRSTVWYDKPPPKSALIKMFGHHPTVEVAKLIDKDWFSNFAIENN